MSIIKSPYLFGLLALALLFSCEDFEEFNQNPNEPTTVSPDVLFISGTRSSLEVSVNESFLLGNNVAQLTTKTLRTEVDAYNWNAFPTVWEGFYRSLTDIRAVERLAAEQGNPQQEGAAVVMRTWVYFTLTSVYGDIPYFDAIAGDQDEFTPSYDAQEDIYADLLDELARADELLSPASGGNVGGDLIFNGDASKWRKLANSLRLRLLMTANNQLADAGSRFADVVANSPIMESQADDAALSYLEGFPNQFPLIPLKQGDFDAVALSQNAFDLLSILDDPRLFRYARPNNDDYSADAVFTGADNGAGAGGCNKAGSRLGAQYWVDGGQTSFSDLGVEQAKGIIMTHAEVEFLLAEAAAKGWISDDVESHYRSGIESSMLHHQVDLGPTQWESFDDFYDNSGVAYEKETDIWEQKWMALFFHGLQPYVEVRRWYVESGMSWDGIPFLSPPCSNVNDDVLPMRFPYPGQEQSLNANNYQAAIDRLGGVNSQNASMWLVQ